MLKRFRRKMIEMMRVNYMKDNMYRDNFESFDEFIEEFEAK